MIFFTTVILPFLKAFWKPIALAIAIGVLVFFIYERGVSNGREACEEDHKLLEQKRDKAVNNKIDDLAKGSTEAANQAKLSTNQINANIKKLLEGQKGPLVIYKDGNCEPTKSFIDTANSMLGEVNGKK